MKWTLNKIIVILNPISTMLYSLTDYRWLTFYIIVLAKLYNDLCEREDEREYCENSYEEDGEDDNENEEEEEKEKIEQDDEPT